jgi:hypothetical protein
MGMLTHWSDCTSVIDFDLNLIAMCSRSLSAPGVTRTPGQRFRKPLLYPPELRGHPSESRIDAFQSKAVDSGVNLLARGFFLKYPRAAIFSLTCPASVSEAALTNDRERCWKRVGRHGRQPLHVLHLRSVRSCNHCSLEKLERRWISRGCDLDISVRPILYPSGQSQLTRFLDHEPPKPDALNAPAYIEMDRFHSWLTSYPQQCGQLGGEGRRITQIPRRRKRQLAIPYSLSDMIQRLCDLLRR